MSRCEDKKMWRWEGVREDVKMRRCERRCEDEKVWEKMWRWEGVREDVKMRRCERRCEDEKGVREDVKMRRCERRCEDERVWEKMWRWEGVREDVKMRRCERRCEDEKVWEKMWRWEGGREDVKMRRWERRCEDEKVWRWEDEIQTPTIGRTLRSDALGKKCEMIYPSQSLIRRHLQGSPLNKFAWTRHSQENILGFEGRRRGCPTTGPSAWFDSAPKTQLGLVRLDQRWMFHGFLPTFFSSQSTSPLGVVGAGLQLQKWCQSTSGHGIYCCIRSQRQSDWSKSYFLHSRWVPFSMADDNVNPPACEHSSRKAFLSETGLRRFSGRRIGSVGASCFVDDFVSCWGKRGAYRLLLEPTWS